MKKTTSQTFSIKYSKLEELERLSKKHDKKLSQIINEGINLWIENHKETIYVDNPHDLENEQETIPDTKPDTEPTEPENELSEEVRETYRDMESFFNGEQDTKPSSFDSVNWDFD